MIFGKRQLVLCTLVCALGAAIYLNWQAAGGELSLLGNNAQQTSGSGQEETQEDGKNYGDVELVSAQGEDADSYFSQVRIQRQQSRDEAIETVKEMFGDSESMSDEDVQTATQTATDITESIEKETKIENMIKAKGFEDCVVFIENGKANVVVKSEGLLPSEAAQIKDIIIGAVDIEPENIRIVEVT